MKHIVNCSFGKDSLAMVIKMREAGMPIDEIIYSRIMFDEETSAEYPLHEKWIYEVAIPKLESWGLKVTIVQASTNYKEGFNHIYTRGQREGMPRGFASHGSLWCKRDLKVNPINRYIKANYDDYIYYTGIAADEKRRIKSARSRKEELPLVDMNITEKECFDICREYDLLSPAYEHSDRLGCWFCHEMKDAALKVVHDEMPELWAELEKLEFSLPEGYVGRNFGWGYRTITKMNEKFRDTERTEE